jgi:hypothetical protein
MTFRVTAFSVGDLLLAYEREQFKHKSSYSGEYYEVEDWSDIAYGSEGIATINGEEYHWQLIESFGGMDKGSYAAVVFEVGDRLFRKEGFYQSHYGYDWDGDLCEVEAYERTVTDYRSIE